METKKSANGKEEYPAFCYEVTDVKALPRILDKLKGGKAKFEANPQKIVEGMLYKNEDDLMERLDLIFGMKGAGNDSEALTDEGHMILDEMLSNGWIEPKWHRKLWKELDN